MRCSTSLKDPVQASVTCLGGATSGAIPDLVRPRPAFGCDAVSCRTGRVRRHWGCHLYFARRVSFLSCADKIRTLSGAKDRGGIIGEIEFQCRLHLFPSEAGDRILHQGYVVSEFCGVTHRRVDAGIRLLANHDQLMDTMLLKLEIQVSVRETAGAPVFLRNHFAGQRREFFAKGPAPGSSSEDTSFVAEFLNGCDVLPALDFILRPPVSVVRREEDSDACGTGGKKDGKHVRYAPDRFCYLLYQRP